MAIHGALTELGGLPVHRLEAPRPHPPLDPRTAAMVAANGITMPPATWPEVGAAGPRAQDVAWVLSASPYEPGLAVPDLLAGLLEAVDTANVRALVVGYWAQGNLEQDTADRIVGLLAAHADRLPALRHLFVNDIVCEQHEISWIPPTDITPLLDAYPNLVELGYRFGTRADDVPPTILRPTRHTGLRRLTLQTGGMPAAVPAAIAACDFPALEHLDLWLGIAFYGGTATVRDLDGLLARDTFPALRHLGLRNSEIQDDIAVAVAGASTVARLHSLDLSMGTLSDRGAEALLAGQPLTHLDELSLRHHFLGAGMRTRVREALEPYGVRVDLSDARQRWEEDDTGDGRYTEVSE
ncbi:STM4015 family protein [Uniformispora flossi]|uniref:STM4015 family protein n=1 Tax=Uniformispora flossi TaxID=3390723 RepID=UPI003C2F3024